MQKEFNETQKFDSLWIYAIVAFVFLFNAIIFTFYIEYDANILNAMMLSLLIIVGLLWMMRLETAINNEGVGFRFYPFKQKVQVPWEDIEECYTRKYKPLKEYRGWGIRRSSHGEAYNTKGNMGIQIVKKNGERILLGTQKEAEAQTTIDQYFRKTS
jgi:hypothetical protein